MSGPLDGLVAPDEAVPRLPVHARVLDLPLLDGRARVLACWADPGGAQALHRELRARVEGTLLGELAVGARPDGGDEAPAPLRALQLVVYPPVERVEAATTAFGFRRVDPGDAALRPALAALRHEAALVGLGDALPEPPDAALVAPVRAPDPALLALERRLARADDGAPWGAEPGAPAARLLAAIEAEGGGAFDPAAPETLARVEARLVAREPGPIRLLPPRVFEALADAVGLVAVRAFGARVEWGLCEPDPETGLAPPPVLRLGRPGGGVYLPVGLELLRWCVMPLAPGESPPTLTEWLADVVR